MSGSHGGSEKCHVGVEESRSPRPSHAHTHTQRRPDQVLCISIIRETVHRIATVPAQECEYSLNCPGAVIRPNVGENTWDADANTPITAAFDGFVLGSAGLNINNLGKTQLCGSYTLTHFRP
jgi:hypothetical protein